MTAFSWFGLLIALGFLTYAIHQGGRSKGHQEYREKEKSGRQFSSFERMFTQHENLQADAERLAEQRKFVTTTERSHLFALCEEMDEWPPEGYLGGEEARAFIKYLEEKKSKL